MAAYRTILLLSCLGLLSLHAFAEGAPKPDQKLVYKETATSTLHLHTFEPAADAAEPRAAIVFFFGGGWVSGTPSQFYPHCALLAEKGMLAMAAEYRVRERDKTGPEACVEDGQDAIRWVRDHAAELKVDPNRIVAAGGSAGGHVAACTAVLTPEADQPAALVLFNPVLDTTKLGYGKSKFSGNERDFSPVHHIRPKLPPTLIFHGTADTTVPFENAERFTKKMNEAGNTCVLKAFPDKKHGFFNEGRDKDNRSYLETTAAMVAFLEAHGLLKPTPQTH